MTTFSIPRPASFRLQAASAFYAGFVPGSGMAAAAVDDLTLVFRLDGTFEPVATRLRERDGDLVVDLAGTRDVDRVRRQLARMLGLDADGDAWLELGRRDALVGKLQQEFPGFFTAAKPSPYDAAVWAVIAPRMNMRQAAAVKTRIGADHGDAVTLAGRTHHVFPGPAVLATLDRAHGLSEEKLARLRAVGQAALEGKLDAERLRATSPGDALAELQSIRGIGPWAASHVYYRGAAPVDGLPAVEPRVLHGLAHVAGIDVPSADRFTAIAESWRPFRMWVCVLLARHLGKTGAWCDPALGRERQAAGKELARRTRKRRAADHGERLATASKPARRASRSRRVEARSRRWPPERPSRQRRRCTTG
jgi:DNA-3-methyladenine glycosylase II